MNIWDFEYKNVEITTTKGNNFRGFVFDIMDKDEMDNSEVVLSIETNDGINYGFPESDIKEIKEI